MPFVDAFLQKSAGDVTRYEGSGGKNYLSIDIPLELSCMAVFFNKFAVPNKMLLSTKFAFEFTRGGVCKRRRGSGMAMRAINSCND